MQDLHNMRLVVKEVSKEDGCLVVVMEDSPRLHNGRQPLLTEDGTLLRWSCRSGTGTMEMREYTFRFEDQDYPLAKGTVLHTMPPDWVQELPDCSVTELTYKAANISFDTKSALDGSTLPVIYDDLKVTVTIEGKVELHKGESKHLSTPKDATCIVSAPETQTLICEMLRCVSQVDCYQTGLFDDTARSLSFRFADGTELEYDDTFGHGDTNTQKIMQRFLCGINAAQLLDDEVFA